MQWSSQPNAGFAPADATPWLPINRDYEAGVNVKDQQQDPASLLNYYRRLLGVRRSTPALVGGDFMPLHPNAKAYLAFVRKVERQTVLVVLNYSPNRLDLDLSRSPHLARRALRTLFSSAGRARSDENSKSLPIGAFEVYIGESA